MKELTRWVVSLAVPVLVSLIGAALIVSHDWGEMQQKIAGLEEKVKSTKDRVDLFEQARQSAKLEDSDQSQSSNGSRPIAPTGNWQWCNMADYREEDKAYINDNPYPIEVAVSTGGRNFCRVMIEVGGQEVIEEHDNNNRYNKTCSASVTVPSGATYRADADGYKGGSVLSWYELRHSCPS